MSNDGAIFILSRSDIASVADHSDILGAVRRAFEFHSSGEGRNFPVVRESLSTGSIFGIKSGEINVTGSLGLKAAGFWPANRIRGQEPHQATIVLIDPSTGRARCVLDGNIITTLRTGAAGALGLKLLARANSKSICVFGTGVQAKIQISFALSALPKLREVTYVTSDGDPKLDFESSIPRHIVVKHQPDPNLAVKNADVVITATPGKGALFDRASISPGTHLNCIGADTRGKRELPVGLIEQSRVIVDDVEQARVLGETQWSPDVPLLQLGDILTGKCEFERSSSDITIFDMTGLALQDITVADLLLAKSIAVGIGTRVQWR